MPVKETNKAPAVETKSEAETIEDAIATIDLAPGFHVMSEGISLGCYPNEDEAKAFAEGHLVPQGIEFTIEAVA